MRSLAVGIALVGITLLGFIGRRLVASRDPLNVPTAEVSLHGFGTLAVPGHLKLERGVWNHVPWRLPPAGEYYYSTQIDIAQAIDTEKITFLLRFNPRMAVGAINKDDGKLTVTLFRSDPEAVDFRTYHDMLYPEATHPPPLIREGDVWTLQGDTYASAYQFDRDRRAALYLTASGVTAERAASVLREMSGSLKRNDTALAQHFRFVDDTPARIRTEIAKNLLASNAELRRLGYAALTSGQPQTRSQETFFAAEETSRVGMPEAHIYRFQTLAILDEHEGRWLAGKLYERNEMGNLIALVHDGGWRTVPGSYLRHELVEQAGLLKAATDPRRVYFLIVHSWPLHSGPWRGQRLTHDARDFDSAIHRVELLRPYYKP